MSLSNRILISLVAGLLTGIGYSQLAAPELAWLPALLEPVGSLWVNAIRMTVIPLLVALVITAIADQQISHALTRMGGQTLGLIITFILLSALLALTLAPALLNTVNIDPEASRALLESVSADPGLAAELPGFSAWLVSLVPANPFAAAADGAVLPLLVFSALFAAAVAQLGEQQRDPVVKLFQAIKDAMFVLIAWIMAAAPIGIFALVFPLAATMGVAAITALAAFILIVCGLILVLILLLYPVACRASGHSLRRFSRTVLPAQAIGFTTRSSLAALPATYAASGLLGVPEKVSGLVLPVAVTLFKYASPLARSAGTFFIANLYGIELGPLQLVTIALAIAVLSFYSPGIPSGGLLIMTPVYLSLGLPVTGIGILIAIDLVVDMFITAANVTANVTLAAVVARMQQAPGGSADH